MSCVITNFLGMLTGKVLIKAVHAINARSDVARHSRRLAMIRTTARSDLQLPGSQLQLFVILSADNPVFHWVVPRETAM